MIQQPTFENLTQAIGLPSTDVAHLKEVANKQGVSPLRVLRDAIHAGMRLLRPLPEPPTTHSSPPDKTPFQIMQESGMVGVAKNLPPDLSSNPKYMEGFGRHDD